MGFKNNKYVLLKSIQILPFLGAALLLILIPACSDKKEEQKARKKKRKSALTIIRTDDCLNCHSIEDKSVGPSYLQVAQRYEADFTTVNRLADKIIEGGGGIWGSDQMSKHPFLKKADARKVVQWILSLKDSTVNKKPTIHTPSVVLSEVFQRTTKAATGLQIAAYSPEQLGDNYTEDFPVIPKNTSPSYSGLADFIHFAQQVPFQPLQEGYLFQAAGFIQIKQKGKYFFKLVKAGKGRVVLNGEVMINENAWDTEIAVDLEPGTYPIAIEYLAAEKNNELSLQWIPPHKEYYQVVPGDVFLPSKS